MDALAKVCVEARRIRLADGMPGGDGMPSEQVLQIIRGRNSPSRPQYYETGVGEGTYSGSAGPTGTTGGSSNSGMQQ